MIPFTEKETMELFNHQDDEVEATGYNNLFPWNFWTAKTQPGKGLGWGLSYG